MQVYKILREFKFLQDEIIFLQGLTQIYISFVYFWCEENFTKNINLTCENISILY